MPEILRSGIYEAWKVTGWPLDVIARQPKHALRDLIAAHYEDQRQESRWLEHLQKHPADGRDSSGGMSPERAFRDQMGDDEPVEDGSKSLADWLAITTITD